MNANGRPNLFFLQSRDGGTNWLTTTNGGTTWTTNVLRVNADGTTNDQWMPAITVRPDGNMLFIGWLDRRNDTNNSLIDVYGRWGTIATDGTVTFGTEFKITTASFPPVFAGTLTNNMEQGHYDPVYPPGLVNLSWHYESAWPPPPEEPPDENVTIEAWKAHVGEYDGAWAEGAYVYVTWTDNRLVAAGTVFARSQRDIRSVRITWP